MPIPTKIGPEYQGVDSRLQPLANEFTWLSKQNNIEFHSFVTMGLKKIDAGNVVGICTYGADFREIDIDIDFWNNAVPTERLAVVFHEMTHCYCGRPHDWGTGTKYPETEKDRIKEALDWAANGGPRPGRYDDGCPTSLMYPIVVGADCVLLHYDEYTKEMFNRCEPY